MTTYVVVAWVITTFYGTRVDQTLSRRVFARGLIAVDLLRPWRPARCTTTSGIWAGPAWLAGADHPAARPCGPAPCWACACPEHWWQTWGVFALLSLLLAHAISFGFAWLVGIASLPPAQCRRPGPPQGHRHQRVLRGADPPGPLPGASCVRWSCALPFQGMSHTPADIFVERFALAAVWQPLVVQASWAVALTIFGMWAYVRATRVLVVQGG